MAALRKRAIQPRVPLRRLVFAPAALQTNSEAASDPTNSFSQCKPSRQDREGQQR